MVVKLLSIGLNGTIGNIREKLEFDCKMLTQEGFRVVIEELDRGGYKFLGLHIVDGELSFRNYEHIKAVLKNSVSKLLADWIIFNEERRIVNKIIADNYFYFNQDERSIVEATALRLLAGNSARYNLVLTRIVDYLETHYEFDTILFFLYSLKHGACLIIHYHIVYQSTLHTLYDNHHEVLLLLTTFWPYLA
jgi:hypothetical protein